jgi:hypothetical protein
MGKNESLGSKEIYQENMGGGEGHFEQRGKSCESEFMCLLKTFMCFVCITGWELLLVQTRLMNRMPIILCRR